MRKGHEQQHSEFTILYYNARSLPPKFDVSCSLHQLVSPKHGFMIALQTMSFAYLIIVCFGVTGIESPAPFFTELSTSLHHLQIFSYSNFILLGDFNVDYSNNCSHPYYCTLSNLMYSFCLTQIVSSHTHVSPNGS